MTIVADHPARTRHDSTLLGSMGRRELVQLLYGDITTGDQHTALAQVAAEADVDPEVLRPATGEPFADPRTATPAGLDDEEIVGEQGQPQEPTQEDLDALDADLDHLTQTEAYDHLVTTYMADVAELLDLPAHDAEELVRSWRIPPHGDIVTVLIKAGRSVVPHA